MSKAVEQFTPSRGENLVGRKFPCGIVKAYAGKTKSRTPLWTCVDAQGVERIIRQDQLNAKIKHRLTEAQRKELRMLAADGSTLQEISDKFGVTAGTVSRIIGPSFVRRFPPRTDISVDEVVRLRQSHMLIREIATHLKCSTGIIRSRLRQAKEPGGRLPNRAEQCGDVTVVWLNRPRTKRSSLPCFIDTVDYPRVKEYCWYVQPEQGGSTFYARTNLAGSKKIFMHVLLTGVKNSDHEDHNGLNNRRENLRPATHVQQGQNKDKKGGARHSSYKGVSFQHGKYNAHITVDKKQLWLGAFEDEKEAARAYNKAALEHFGEFAVLNEIDDVSNLALGGVWINGPLRGQKANL